MMSQTELPPPRLFLIMARRAPVAVIFRRGPSKWTRVIRWDTKSNRLGYGQWFKGRIYERRCDLSPDGTKLIYFVSKFNKRTIADSEYTYAWTAISKPPWLTALALWPKGDCWHGGGMFLSDKKVLLNHRPNQAEPHPKHKPHKITVVSNPEARGEDDPLYSMRLTRDGWKVTQEWRTRYRYPEFYITDQPERRELCHPWKPRRLVMERSIGGLEYSETFRVVNTETGQCTELSDVDFASWDQRGRLTLLRNGQLQVGHISDTGEPKVSLVDDFSKQSPEELVSPAWARRW